MAIYKTIIVEGNFDNTVLLKKIILENHPDLHIIAEANTVATAKEILVKYKPNIVLMAIEIADGTSFDVLTDLIQVQDVGFEIIFISTHRNCDYAAKAIEFDSLAFLSQPIDPKILRGAIQKAKEKQIQKKQIEQLIVAVKALEEQEQQIIIPIAKPLKKTVPVADITFLEAKGRTTIVHFKDNSNIVSCCNLGHFKKTLRDKHPFALIHGSFLVNIKQVESFKHAELLITLKNGTKLITSRRFGKDFKNYWEDNRL